MNPYKQYKPSGIEWLGEVPEHWEVKRLKFMAVIQNGQDYKHIVADEGYPVIGSGGQFAYASNYLYDGESILLGRKGTIDKPLYINGKFWTVDTIFYTQIAKDVVPKFLYYCTLTVDFWCIATQTALPSVTATALSNLQFAVPPLSEQTAIAAYLDERTAYLDRLIAKQQALSEKLSEKRTALITEEVCGRLHINMRDDHRNNPNGCRDTELTPALRDSGIQWLGEIPEHWEVWKITHLVEFIGSGTTPKSDNPAYYDGETLWVTTSELRENYISDTKQKVSQEAIKDFSTLKIYPKNSVAIAMYGATIGRLGILEKEATFNQACCVFVPSEKLHYKFLFYWLWHRRPILISLSNGGGQPNLSQDDLKKIKIAIPSYKEQTAIATYLDKETAKIDRLQAKIAESVARLQEYRAALITQVVTGKVQVAAPAV